MKYYYHYIYIFYVDNSFKFSTKQGVEQNVQ